MPGGLKRGPPGDPEELVICEAGVRAGQVQDVLVTSVVTTPGMSWQFSAAKRSERLIEIRDQVLHVFDADGNPDQAVTNAERATAFR